MYILSIPDLVAPFYDKYNRLYRGNCSIMVSDNDRMYYRQLMMKNAISNYTIEEYKPVQEQEEKKPVLPTKVPKRPRY